MVGVFSGNSQNTYTGIINSVTVSREYQKYKAFQQMLGVFFLEYIRIDSSNKELFRVYGHNGVLD